MSGRLYILYMTSFLAARPLLISIRLSFVYLSTWVSSFLRLMGLIRPTQLRLGVLFTALSTLSIFAGSEFPTTRSNVVINPLLHGYWISRQHLYRDIYYDTTAWCAITERRRSRTEEENFCVYIYIYKDDPSKERCAEE